MSDIANLQQAVETARAAYTRASEQHARSRKHAMSLIHIVEEQLREKRIELSQNEIQQERMTRDYGQLRQMLHALVMTVEVGAEAQQNGAAAIGTQPKVVTPLAPALAPVPVPALAPAPAPAPVPESAPAKTSSGAEELRAGLKRMLKKKRPNAPSVELATVEAEGVEAPAPAE